MPPLNPPPPPVVDDLEGHSSLRKLRPSMHTPCSVADCRIPTSGSKSPLSLVIHGCAAWSQGWQSEGMERREETERVGDKLGKTQRNGGAQYSRRDWKEKAQTHTHTYRDGGRKGRREHEGRRLEQESYWLSPLNLPYWKKKQETKSNIIIWEETGGLPDSSRTRTALAVIRHSFQHSSKFITTAQSEINLR